jgi:hypothetical protein
MTIRTGFGRLGRGLLGLRLSLGLGLWWRGLWLGGLGVGREEVVAIAVDGGADGCAPVIGVEGLTVLMLGNVDGLHESLRQVGDRVRGFGF